MKNGAPGYGYFLALIIGLVIVFVPDREPVHLSLGLMFLFSGTLLGVLWPAKSWRWGLWLSSPMLVLMGLSLVFSGNVEIFVKKDLLPISVSVFAACTGGFTGAWLRIKYSAT